jgi:hypothetical protein
VVDGSNLATEGRTAPSLVQLDEAVRAFIDENPKAEVIVVADATFEHRVAPADRARFKEAELAGEIVTPPAGAVGRGDAFILKIADRIDAVVLSNDSFQEFHDVYTWLFDVGRLVGGKPVPGVGWVFTPRIPVRGTKVTARAKKLAAATAAPVAPAKAKRAAPKADLASKVEHVPKVEPVKPAKVTRKEPVKAKRAAKKADATKVEVAKATKDPVAPAAALRRGRQPVNPALEFDQFVARHRVRSNVEGEVVAFSSHGAIVAVDVDGTRVECYAPTTLMGDPPPARARDVLKRGDKRSFRLTNVDRERRIAELALK